MDLIFSRRFEVFSENWVIILIYSKKKKAYEMIIELKLAHRGKVSTHSSFFIYLYHVCIQA